MQLGRLKFVFLRLARPEFTNVGVSKQIVLDEDVPYSTIVDLMVTYYLLDSFAVLTMIEDDCNSLDGVHLCRRCQSLLPVAKFGQPILFLVGRVFDPIPTSGLYLFTLLCCSYLFCYW